MALQEFNLLFGDSVVRLRVTAADGVNLRAQLSSSASPLRLEFFDENNEGSAEVTLAATIVGEKAAEAVGDLPDSNGVPAKKARLADDRSWPRGISKISRAVPILLQPGGVASLRLDNILTELTGDAIRSSGLSLISGTHADSISLPTSRVSIHFITSSASAATRVFPLHTVTLRVDGIDFRFTRELLCFHSDFFRALLDGDSFAESGKDLVELKTFSEWEITFLHDVIQRGSPIKTENILTALAVADSIQSHSLMLRTASLPIPRNLEEKEEWLLRAQKYNNMLLANRIVSLIPQTRANDVHLRLLDEITNKDVYRMLLKRATGTLRSLMNVDVFIVIIMEELGTVRVRLFTDEHPYVTEYLRKVVDLQ